MPGILEIFKLAKDAITTTTEGGNVGEMIDKMTMDEADAASVALRALNDYDMKHPYLSRMLRINKLVDFVDEQAYNIGSTSGKPLRDPGEIDYNVNIGSAKYGAIDNYTGIENAANPPNLLKIYLGIDKNVLPESDVKPSSWTKGDPEQGWRSIKEYSTFSLPDESDMQYHKEWFDKASKESTEGYGVNMEAFKKLKTSVEEGTYDPSEHAITLDQSGYGSVSAPGLWYTSDVDTGARTESIGYDVDKEEYYFSMTDVWDFEPEGYDKGWGDARYSKEGIDRTTESSQAYTQAALMHGVGRPIGLYDRYPIPKETIDFWAKEGPVWETTIEDKLVSAWNQD